MKKHATAMDELKGKLPALDAETRVFLRACAKHWRPQLEWEPTPETFTFLDPRDGRTYPLPATEATLDAIAAL